MSGQSADDGSCPPDGDNLPSYQFLEQQESTSNPNARFGRWKEWIEKRASERYMHHEPPHAGASRPNRGWGETIESEVIETSFSAQEEPPSYSSTVPPVIPGERLAPCHLSRFTFGSRFLPHSRSHINAILPIMNDRFILMGGPSGLSVLDVLPRLHGDEAMSAVGGLSDAKKKDIWEGEAVWQMEWLEEPSFRSDGEEDEGAVHAIILVLVGSEGDDRTNSKTELRMYDLASMIKLVQWTTTRQDSRPLAMQQKATIRPHSHRHSGSLAQSLKSLLLESPITSLPSPSLPFPFPPPPPIPPKDGQQIFPSPLHHQLSDSPTQTTHSQNGPVSPSPSNNVHPRAVPHKNSTDSSWDIIDPQEDDTNDIDQPIRWATSYVPFTTKATATSPILSFELYRPPDGSCFLAVATKGGILLYERPRGQKGFQFIKDFYTPLAPRSISFVRQQSAPEAPLPSRRASVVPNTLHKQHIHPEPHSHSLRASPSIRVRTTSTHTYLCIYVNFDKKASLIRVRDSAVFELDLWDESSEPTAGPSSSSTSVGSSFRRFDQASKWLPLSQIVLPASLTMPEAHIALLTKGKQTNIHPSPLPSSPSPPLRILTWQIHPTRIVPRVCHPAHLKSAILQVIAFGDDGMEIQEMSIPSVITPTNVRSAHGKGKAPETRRMLSDVSQAGFLCIGGKWHEHSSEMNGRPQMQRYDSAEEERRQKDLGVYAWESKGLDDWRVFWLGGGLEEYREGSEDG